MDAERARAFLLTLPHTVETQQWGDNLVFWVGDKAIGGKMFALINLDHSIGQGVISYSAGPERYAELVEREYLVPAPYMARIHWVAADSWAAHRNTDWEEELRAAHQITYDKLPPKVRDILALPTRERTQLIADRRKILAEKCATPGSAIKKPAKKQSAKKKRGAS